MFTFDKGFKALGLSILKDAAGSRVYADTEKQQKKSDEQVGEKSCHCKPDEERLKL